MNSPIGLYIHVPFCRRKCPYCDFYSVEYSDPLASDYADAVIRNLRGRKMSFDTVYFGGGTPVLLYRHIGRILEEISLAENAEITAECNPCFVTEESMDALLSAGVNRLSVGVQSCIDSELRALGRLHDYNTAARALNLAHRAGFRNISADLMLGIPAQTHDSLATSLERLCALPVDHISAYMLKIEPSTPFGRNPPEIPDEDDTADLYMQTVQTLAAHGFGQYEISNFARAGMECRHNLKYWRREEYLGIGPAAHSFVDGRRFFVERDIHGFIAAPKQLEVTDSLPDEYEERVMLGLRLSEGIPESLWKLLESGLSRIPKNYYRIENGRLSLTAEGFLLSNEIISILLSINN